MSLKVARETRKFLICYCHKHEDKNVPNLYINKVKNNGYPKGFAKCFRCGWTGHISEEIVDKMSQKPTYYREKDVKSEIDWDELACEYNAAWSCSPEIPGLWNMGDEKLAKLGCGYNGQAHTFPIRNENNIIIGIQCQLNGRKWCMEGSKIGIFVPQIPVKSPAYICEGCSDTATALDLGFYGIGKFNALTTNDIILKFLIKHNINKVVIVPDCDHAGHKGCENLQRILLTKDIEFDIISVEPWKDLREFRDNEGKERTEELLKG